MAKASKKLQRVDMHDDAVMRIEFSEHGQDFLWWDVADDGRVVDCGPFQQDVWCKCTVVDEPPTSLKRGDKVQVTSSAVPGRVLTICYPLAKVTLKAAP